MGNPIAFAYLVVALVDYVVKAVFAFRDTEQGQAEWLDVETRYDEAFGDTDGAAVSRQRASDIRSKSAASQSAKTAPARINLSE